MKILQINKFFYIRGGAERHYFDLSALLEKKGDTVIPFSMQGAKNIPSLYDPYFVSPVHFDRIDSTTFRRGGRIFYSWEARRKLKKLIQQESPDIAHLHLIYHHISPSIILELQQAGIPIVMTVHDWQLLCPNYNLLLPNGHICTECQTGSYAHVFFKKAIKNSYIMSGLAAVAGWWHHKRRWYENGIDRLIVPSEFAYNLFVSYGWPKEKLRLIPHFYSRSILSQPVQKKGYLLYAGRLSKEKGVTDLVRYWHEQQIKYPLYIAGRGPEQAVLEQLIAEYGLQQYIRLLGFLSTEELDTYIQQAAAVIVPSRCFETFGLSIIEAWANGTAVIASDIGALKELVTDSGAGVLFSWEKNTLKQVIDSYMKHEETARDMGKQGITLVHKKYMPAEYYTAVTQVYTELV